MTSRHRFTHLGSLASCLTVLVAMLVGGAPAAAAAAPHVGADSAATGTYTFHDVGAEDTVGDPVGLTADGALATRYGVYRGGIFTKPTVAGADPDQTYLTDISPNGVAIGAAAPGGPCSACYAMVWDEGSGSSPYFLPQYPDQVEGSTPCGGMGLATIDSNEEIGGLVEYDTKADTTCTGGDTAYAGLLMSSPYTTDSHVSGFGDVSYGIRDLQPGWALGAASGDGDTTLYDRATSTFTEVPNLDLPLFDSNHILASDGAFIAGLSSSEVPEYRAPDGTITALTPPSDQSSDMSASSMNDSHQIVGESIGHVLYWSSPTAAPTNLEELPSIPSSDQLATADEINDVGDIAGTFYASDGSTHVYLLTPSNEQLTISSLTFDPPHPTVADGTFTATLTLRNDTSGTLTDVVPTLTSSDPDGLSIDSGPDPATAASLAAGDSVSFTFELTPKKAETVNLQPAATAKDSDGNTVTATPVPPRVVDLSAGDVSVSVSANPSTVAVNSATTVTATITNKTTETLTNLTPSLTSTPASNVTIGDPSPATVASLDPHASTTVTWSFTASNAATYQLQAAVDLTDPATSNQETDVGSFGLTVNDGTIVVNSTDDTAEPDDALANKVCDVDPDTAGNQCTLRAAIKLADSLTDSPQSITFDISGGGVPDITPTSALPAITNSVTIDGSTEPGGWVQLSGASDSTSDNALTISGANDTIRGLVIDGWSNGAGVAVTSSDSDVTLVGDRIGTDPSGTSAVPNQNGVAEVAAGGSASGTLTIGGVDSTTSGSCTGDCDLISGNTNNDVDIDGENGAIGAAAVIGDFIGTDVTGEHALPGSIGVAWRAVGKTSLLLGGASSSPGVAPGNVIAGETTEGVDLGVVHEADGTAYLEGNLIGLDAQGAKSLEGPVSSSSGSTGVDMAQFLGGSIGAYDSEGKAVPSEGNVVSGWGNGISTGGPALVGDRVGTDITGMHAVPNYRGVTDSSAPVIDSQVSGNLLTGILAGTADLYGNLIGTTADGLAALPNGGDGVRMSSGEIGGVRPVGSTSCVYPCNLISGNGGDGIATYGGAFFTYIQGNFVGTNATGTAAIPNDTDPPSNETSTAAAVIILNSAGAYPSGDGAKQVSNAVSTGVCDQACNLISGNDAPGVRDLGGGVLLASMIGGTSTGDPLPNQGAGVVVDGAGGVVGGDFPNRGNRIIDNAGPAVEDHTGAATVEGNTMAGNAGGITVDGGDPVRVPQRPQVTGAVRSGGRLLVAGDVVDLSSAGFTGTHLDVTSRLDVYASTSCSPAVNPQGERPLGSGTVGILDGLSGGHFQFAVPAPPTGVGFAVITSTEADPADSANTATSPFSECVLIDTAALTMPRPGQADTAAAPGFKPGEKVTITLHSTPTHLTTVTAGSSGVAKAHVTIPKSTPAGSHELIFTGETSHHVAIIPITVTPKPQAGLLHLLAPKALTNKKVTHTAKVTVAGHAGIPKRGARHALMLAHSTTRASVDGHVVPAHTSELLVVPMTKAKITVNKRGTVKLIALGWYAKAKSTSGDVYRALKHTTVKKSGVLTAGSHRLPWEPGLDGVVMTVTSKRNGTTVGGVAVAGSKQPTTIVARVIDGFVKLHLAKHAEATIVGWYGQPDAAAGGKTTG